MQPGLLKAAAPTAAFNIFQYTWVAACRVVIMLMSSNWHLCLLSFWLSHLLKPLLPAYQPFLSLCLYRNFDVPTNLSFLLRVQKFAKGGNLPARFSIPPFLFPPLAPFDCCSSSASSVLEFSLPVFCSPTIPHLLYIYSPSLTPSTPLMLQ